MLDRRKVRSTDLLISIDKFFADGKGKNKQQTPAYTLKKDDHDQTEQNNGEPLIGPKLPPEYEVKSSFVSFSSSLMFIVHLEKDQQRTFLYSTRS